MSYTVFPTDGDTITEAEWTSILDRANARDYVERGLTVSLNGDGTFDVGSGLAFIRDSGNNQTYPVEDESGTTGVQLADTSTTNYVYLTFDPSASDVEGSVEYHVDTDQTPPAGQPSLLIAEANESTSTVTPQNREPALSADEITINDSLTASGLTLSDDPSNPTTILDYLGSHHNSTLATSEDTVAGDNTATTIANLASAASNNVDSFYTWIMGRKQGGAASFIDEVTLVGNDGLAAVNHQDSRNTVSRSYGSAAAGTAISLAIDDSGETYDVGVIMLGGGQKQ